MTYLTSTGHRSNENCFQSEIAKEELHEIYLTTYSKYFTDLRTNSFRKAERIENRQTIYWKTIQFIILERRKGEMK
jgi:hypothetical protein